MKTITLPKLTKFDPRIQLKSLLENGPQGGYTIAEVRSGIRILDKLDSLAEDATELVLEDSDYVFVAARVNSTPWMVAHPDIVAFVDAIENPT